jgi:hypothetical protein
VRLVQAARKPGSAAEPYAAEPQRRALLRDHERWSCMVKALGQAVGRGTLRKAKM